MKRTLSKFEEHIVRLCHHDFGGLPIEDAAAKIDITVPKLRGKLRQIKRKCPQLFPILTPQHQAILMMQDKHMSRISIAATLGISEKSLIKKITFLRKHKFLWDHKVDQYSPLVDGQVKERF